MTITMNQVQSLDILNSAVIRTGELELETTPVKWVSVIETPVETFVRKNELVLTSGVGCADNEKLFYDFVKEIIDSGASGLAVAIGPFIKTIPHSIIQLAEKHQFILIELDWSIRFSDILENVLGLIHDQKHQHLEKIEQLRKSLLEFILSGKSLNIVADHVASSIHSQVLIADKRGVIRGKSQSFSDHLVESWADFLHTQLQEDGIYHSLDQTFDWIEYNEGYALQLTIHSTGNIQGYIVVGGFGAEPFSEEEHNEWVMLLEHVTTAVAIHFLHEQAAKEAEWRLRDDFVWELSRDAIPSIELMKSRAKSLNYHINLPYICIVAKPEQVQESFHAMTHLSITFDHWLHEWIRHMEEEAESIAKSMALKSMVTYQNEELIIFLEVNHPQVIEQAKTYINKLQSRFHFLNPSLSITWGIAKQYGYSCFAISYQEAKKAREIGRKRNGRNTISVYADTKVDRVMESLLKNDELIDIAKNILDSLLRYANERQIDLLYTFKTYHQNHGNVSQTARELNLHRQSLLYRLRKIESLTNCSLDHPDDVFLLDLSIRLWLHGLDMKETEYRTS
ncbi:PucR family transcriptional regulator ligand-binding domain-containing protein [Alkalihalobacillus sp. MEB130]|uniref:PucR family transcriptional regulator n=1 Tax=Alkalihalobacillus sp. MEB130 TaxID=2976704 RepID=UPI0028DED52B|nr:PucR family transcriptional regulator ligand-binding domain-containing protein [Alkalihalobacillus sp. MEB130]MDT8859933.1 PucR family transcriptional regulator ligand-binding domain-containing protein [Alkalihalobacillus sp. MEB130]